MTILTDDYIPPIILAEEENSQLDVVDGGSRTAACMMFRYGNYRISYSVENPVIPYKKKIKDESGNIIWEEAFFNIKGKTYEQLPEELKKKFNGYQLETVIHENCDKAKIATYIKRYNEHTSMNTSQKAFTYIDKFAGKIHDIVDSKFFVNNKMYSNCDKNKGVVERIAVETIMCMNHFDNWKAQPKMACKYLNNNATEEEFDVLINRLHRLEDIITDDIIDIFNKKDSFIFLTLFDRFTKFKVEDAEFANFLKIFKADLRDMSRNKKGLLFDEIDKDSGTKDKRVISEKLEMLEGLLTDFLHVGSQDEHEVNNREELFIADVLDMDIDEFHDDLEDYKATLDRLLDNTVKYGSRILDEQNRLSLLAMIIYSYREDKDLDKWMTNYASRNNTYFTDQKENFLHMKTDFENYLKKYV